MVFGDGAFAAAGGDNGSVEPLGERLQICPGSGAYGSAAGPDERALRFGEDASGALDVGGVSGGAVVGLGGQDVDFGFVGEDIHGISTTTGRGRLTCVRRSPSWIAAGISAGPETCLDHCESRENTPNWSWLSWTCHSPGRVLGHVFGHDVQQRDGVAVGFAMGVARLRRPVRRC